MITNALLDRELPVYGSGANVRDWLYVDDHARALRTICETGRPGESYLVGGRNERSNLTVVETIIAILDHLRPRATGSYRELIRFVEDRPGHDFRYAIDPSKLESELGWSAHETFETGIEKTVAWYLANDDWWMPLRLRRYAGERLGLPAGAAGVQDQKRAS
jgi:dTDP-glucose 4,6-dehydratase